MVQTVNERVKKYRENLRRSGLRPVQIWMPDTRRKGFKDQCHQQATLVALSDQNDPQLLDFLDEAASDLEGWDE